MPRHALSVVLLACSATLPGTASAQAPPALSDSAFVALSQSLSEKGGYFDTDNLISNEDSYLLPLSTLRRLGVRGGAFIGVGPDQSFSYIAAVRPRIAFIVDIRRDNLLEHLLYKSIFALSRTRIDYLCLLFGVEPPADTTGWGARDIGELLRAVDSARSRPHVSRSIVERVMADARRDRLLVGAGDLSTIQRFHETFVRSGPALQFNSFNRAPQPYYPDFRRLMLERDREGRQGSFLAREADFQAVKSLEDHNLVVPVVGDFAGPHALTAIAAWLVAHGETTSAFYTSNVEQYLFRDGGFQEFATSVVKFPRDATSVMIRSYFGMQHPQSVPGYHATQVVQSLSRFVELTSGGQLMTYSDLIGSAHITP